MTAPDPKFDAELAWDIQEWARFDQPSQGTRLDMTEVKALAAFLTEKGYGKGKASGLGSLLSTLEDVGTRVADEFGPLIDTLRKK